MSRPAKLTPTSFALLGLLAIKPWTTYELAQQMDFAMSRFWPRARSKVYEEPKKLVAHGLAAAAAETVGKRGRTVYSITPKGRRALAAWIAEPSDGPVLESEQLLKVFFADSGTTAELRATLAGVREWVHMRTLVNIDVGRAYLEGRGAFPERAAVNQLVGAFLEDFLEALDAWAERVDALVATWPDRPGEAEFDVQAMEQTVERSIRRAERWRAAAGEPRHGHRDQ